MRVQTASERLRSILETLDMSRRSLALEAGLPPASLDYYFTSRYKRRNLPANIVAEIETPLLRRGVDEHEIWALTEIGQRPQSRAGAAVSRVPLVGMAQADYWGPSLNLNTPEHPLIELPASIRRLHGYQDTFLIEVRGTAMNLKFPPGTLLECVTPGRYGQVIGTGDFVILERRNSLGQCETTVRQLEIRSDGSHWLWPRSDDPASQQPLEVPPTGHWSGMEGELKIRGIVVFVYSFPPR